MGEVDAASILLLLLLISSYSIVPLIGRTCAYTDSFTHAVLDEDFTASW
jgi:hypothetical protein